MAIVYCQINVSGKMEVYVVTGVLSKIWICMPAIWTIEQNLSHSIVTYSVHYYNCEALCGLCHIVELCGQCIWKLE
jgi:hypothetical protein